jgi:AraC-like DNA-binding protein
MTGEFTPQDPELLRRLLRAKDRMDAASHEAWPVQRLAQVSGISEAHFARQFKEAFGIPPHRYLLTRRIEKAVALLRDTDLPITDIAFQTGWESLGTFGRTFRDITGETPKTIRGRAKPTATQFAPVPVCIVAAAQRPQLTTAVSEKRRRAAGDIKTPPEQRRSNEPGRRSGRSVREGPGRGSRVLRGKAGVSRPYGREKR